MDDNRLDAQTTKASAAMATDKNVVDVQSIFNLLKHLTRQTHTKDLVNAMTELLIANFSGVFMVVYELQATRIDDTKRQCLLCLDLLHEHESRLLQQDALMAEAFDARAEISRRFDKQRTEMVIPVELYDKSISHLIKVSHPYQNSSACDLLEGLLDIFRDIFRNLHEKGYDPLTRILNRQAFDQITSNLAYGKKFHSSRKPLEVRQFKAIAILDIDRFKSINDRYGHAIGDETLVLFAQTLRNVLRQEDLFFRYGGEEFVVLVKDVDSELAHIVLERCRDAIAKKRFPQVGEVTVSIGFADLEPQCHPVDTLSKADKALYFVKKNGRNQVQSYDHLVANGQLKPIHPIEGSADFWDDE